MGTNCAPQLANLYLASYELGFCRRLANVHQNSSLSFLRTLVKHIARAFLFTCRFLDDLASISNPYLQSLLYLDQHYVHPSICGIYPRILLVSIADSGTSINYMDITILLQPGSDSHLTTWLFDKREHPPLRGLFIIKFPHASSQISDTAKYGIVTSQFHRFRRIIMSGDNFILRMADLVLYMVYKGHHAVRMLDRVNGLSRRFPELYGRDPKVLWEAISREFYTMTGHN